MAATMPRCARKSARELRIEPARVVAREGEHAIHVLIPAQRDEREAAHARQTGAEVIVLGRIEGAEPGLLEARELRKQRGRRVGELDLRVLLEDRRVVPEQVAQLEASGRRASG